MFDHNVAGRRSPMDILGYTIIEKLRQNNNVTLFRATRTGKEESCILKVVERSVTGNLKAVSNLRHEYRLLREIDSPHVVKVLDWIEDKAYACLSLEDINGNSLKDTLPSGGVGLNEFMEIASRIVGGLIALHLRNIIHKDINLFNIVWDRQSRLLKIIDLNIAGKFDSRISFNENPEELEGTIAYMSPEQTGRMNRSVDRRTDMYSLGVSFYELLTGRLPFPGQDYMKMIYCHLARSPRPPHKLNPDTPRILSDIIMKLMAKKAEDRYQSAEGLKHDLEEIQASGFRQIALGKWDFSGKLQIPEKLYGREKERERLLCAYEDVSSGRKKMLLVSGYSGTGKTTLVQEVIKPITRNQGIFVSGKFDQLQRNVPYYALSQALDQFFKRLLRQHQSLLDQWKARILEAVGDLGRLLTDIIPSLEAVIGAQPDVPNVSGGEAQRRFNHVFQNFIRVLTDKKHPLVIFIDDLQWADLASLSLIQLMMTDPNIRYFLFIGAYRDNEVSSTHPLTGTVEEIKTNHGTPVSITINNLTQKDLESWLEDMLLDTSHRRYEDLARLIFEKTQGNAFFSTRFVENLYEENFLNFDFSTYLWCYDIEKIKALNITDNVVELMIGTLKKQPPALQELMQLAACCGNRFSTEILSIIATSSGEEISEQIEKALTEHLVSPLDGNQYAFAHDRIHQAAYALISQSDRQSVHLKIGRFLMREHNPLGPGTQANAPDHLLFDITDHLNIAMDLIRNPEERLTLARLNQKAARKAKIAAAYKPGGIYAGNALALLPQNSWKNNYELTLSCFNEALQLAYLSGNYDEMNKFIDTVIERAADLADTTVAYQHRILSLIFGQGRPDLAVETLLEIFTHMGIDILQSPESRQIMAAVEEVDALIEETGIDALLEIPAMNNPEKELVLTLYDMGHVAFIIASGMTNITVVCRMVSLSIKHGITPETPLALSVLGIIKIIMGDLSGAYALGQIAKEMADRRFPDDLSRYRAIDKCCIYMLGNKMHYKALGTLMMAGYQKFVSFGDFESAGSVVSNHFWLIARTDEQLPVLREKARGYLETVVQMKQFIPTVALQFGLAYTEKMLGITENPASLGLDLEEMTANMPEQIRNFITCSGTLWQLTLAFFFEADGHLPDLADNVLERWNQASIPITYLQSDIYFFPALAYLRCFGLTRSEGKKSAYMEKAQQGIEGLRQWAEFGPLNFSQKFHLLEAESARVTGDDHRAATCYDKAISQAYENGYVNDAAIASELAAKYYMAQKRNKIASVYLTEALECYDKWGAAAKVNQLKENYPRYLAHFHANSQSTSISVTIGDIDIKSILKASQTLAGEVQVRPMLINMMQILVENAGAQKGVFIEIQNGKFIIQAEGDIDSVHDVLKNKAVDTHASLPLSVINYVARTKDPLVFDNISRDSDYRSDPFILDNKTKSCVCFPVLNKGALSAIIYLENNLVEGAFTPSRVEVLNMLSSQIAISLENTRLYENLEEKIRQRTLALEESHQKLEKSHEDLEKTHKQIVDSVYYAGRIQTAVLPADNLISEMLKDYFILNLPHSVVSGDFYWVRKVDAKIVVAIVDCTGHGVPGALVSMLGTAFLNEIVPLLSARGRLRPDHILNSMRDRIKSAFRKSIRSSYQQEGMDIALCMIDPGHHRLDYAGAYNPFYMIREGRMIEIKADRMPVGRYVKETPFTNHSLDLSAGDTIYLFSDGYPDQISHGDGKRLGTKRFKELLIQINREPMEKQKQLLLQRFEKHKGPMKQVDDILVFGMRF